MSRAKFELSGPKYANAEVIVNEIISLISSSCFDKYIALDLLIKLEHQCIFEGRKMLELLESTARSSVIFEQFPEQLSLIREKERTKHSAADDLEDPISTGSVQTSGAGLASCTLPAHASASTMASASAALTSGLPEALSRGITESWGFSEHSSIAPELTSGGIYPKILGDGIVSLAPLDGFTSESSYTEGEG